MTDLGNRVALVTSGGRGIGKAIAQRYGRLGASVIVNDLSVDAAQETAATVERAGGTAVAIQADVSKVVEIERLFAAVLERFGRLDIVAANAGGELVGQPVLDFTEHDFDRVFAVNTKGAFFTLQKAARFVADHGRLIYVGSSTTAFPFVGGGFIVAAKSLHRCSWKCWPKRSGRGESR